MRKLKSPLSMFLVGGTLIALLLVSSFYLEMKNSLHFFARQGVVTPSPTSSPSSTPAAPDECETEKGNIQALLAYFEQLQQQRDAKKILTLFTPPLSLVDKADYANLSNNNGSSPRLYNNLATNIKLSSYKVTAGPVKSVSHYCLVTIEEMRSYYGGPIDPHYSPIQPENLVMVLQRQDNKWLIEQYQSLNPHIKKGKYGGWLMEINQNQ